MPEKSTAAVLDELAKFANHQTGSAADDHIGLFQSFRPLGHLPPWPTMEAVPGGIEFIRRLNLVYEAVGSSERADNMKDAFFVVRNPPFLSADEAKVQALRFVDCLVALGQVFPSSEASIDSASAPEARVLEGKPPKHPRSERERPALLRWVSKELASNLDTAFPSASVGSALSQALYFIACDHWLREFLRQPLLDANAAPELRAIPLTSYFELWRHGVKFRIFQNHQIDFYLPRRADGSLIQAGQFAS